MAGLVPAIYVFLICGLDVDARHKAGHDGVEIDNLMCIKAGELPVSQACQELF
ncbi:hypothetical protein [Tardiphaga sp. 709]|uniref:hypothetical protein n=1 Tax=Tardiphaga sp. 709 TaxID=3076039 RepID=UPI0028E848F5|nr:hypothetical protein [Tardiphaga sp. 709]WNV08957.1 hypothetical protein RSO67_26370 [Tardiphaga sp. 709]